MYYMNPDYVNIIHNHSCDISRLYLYVCIEAGSCICATTHRRGLWVSVPHRHGCNPEFLNNLFHKPNPTIQMYYLNRYNKMNVQMFIDEISIHR